MTEKKRSTHRNLEERIWITGTLILETPAHLGNGDAEALVDMPLLLDESDGKPLLTGTSIAGALRSYLRERQTGYEHARPKPGAVEFPVQAQAERQLAATLLFGGFSGDDEGLQSPLIVYDALGNAPKIELRDGVKIDKRTRTAEEKKKFDIQLLPAGTTFDLNFELLISKPDGGSGSMPSQDILEQALATALDGLAKAQIRLGMRKRRGFGRCRVDSWSVRRYHLRQPVELLAWISSDHTEWCTQPVEKTDSAIQGALGLKEALLDDKRQSFEIEAELRPLGTLLIRSGFGESDLGPDVVHLHALHADQKQPKPELSPVLPGTSIAGPLRARALRIARRLASDDELAEQLVDNLFGPENVEEIEHPYASRLEVDETAIHSGKGLVVSRVKIDRFTGGAADTALFEEQPLVSSPETRVSIRLRLRNPQPAEMGLLVLLLKDLWTGELPLGGEASIGRGRFEGVGAAISAPGDARWVLSQEINPQGKKMLKIEKGDPGALQEFVDKLKEELQA